MQGRNVFSFTHELVVMPGAVYIYLSTDHLCFVAFSFCLHLVSWSDEW